MNCWFASRWMNLVDKSLKPFSRTKKRSVHVVIFLLSFTVASLLQALRSLMQKPRSWWVLRRLYSILQTGRTFMNNLFHSSLKRQVFAEAVFSFLLPHSIHPVNTFLFLVNNQYFSSPQEVLAKQRTTSHFSRQFHCPFSVSGFSVLCLTVFKWTCALLWDKN